MWFAWWKPQFYEISKILLWNWQRVNAQMWLVSSKTTKCFKLERTRTNVSGLRLDAIRQSSPVPFKNSFQLTHFSITDGGKVFVSALNSPNTLPRETRQLLIFARELDNDVRNEIGNLSRLLGSWQRTSQPRSERLPENDNKRGLINCLLTRYFRICSSYDIY